jgi:hypothetical protein
MSRLSQYFTGVAVKRLSAVETDPMASNQHEYNGVSQMVAIFGGDRIVMPCRYLYLGNDEEETTIAKGTLTWYDARERHQNRTEYRLYFQGNSVTELAVEGDLLIIGRRLSGDVLALVAKQGSTFERQVLWLFGIIGESRTFSVAPIEGISNKEIGYAERTILEALGVEIETPETDWLDTIIARFGLIFPTTRIFSEFARETMHSVVLSTEDPDNTLLAWINQEELLFRALERRIVQERLDQGFDSVDDFVEFSLSVHNRRKSRVGFALENHLEQLFIENGVTFSRGQVTENRAKPDFIFPHISHYRDTAFPSENLTMLGAKSTCKDRWRQVLSEARRIDQKHLFTLEPGISQNQTDEMEDNRLRLVLPTELHSTYLQEQQTWLMNLTEFINLVVTRQP